MSNNLHPGNSTLTLSRPECPKDWWYNRRLLLITPRGHKGNLSALLEAYRENAVKHDVLCYGKSLPPEVEIAKVLDDADAALFIVPGNRAPRTVIGGPYIISENNRKVPVGILPAKSKEAVKKFAMAANQVHLREKYKPVLALLSQRHPRYLRVSDRIETILKSNDGSFSLFKWTGDVMFKEDMLKGINSGLGVALYVGHGRPVGWVGYYGTRAHHFDDFIFRPLGSMLSICCHTASRNRTGISFSEEIVLKGVAASSFGAVAKTKYTDNTKWAVRIIENLLDGIPAIGELILRALPQNDDVNRSYRLIGDPLAPLFASKESICIASTINTYS